VPAAEELRIQERELWGGERGCSLLTERMEVKVLREGEAFQGGSKVHLALQVTKITD